VLACLKEVLRVKAKKIFDAMVFFCFLASSVFWPKAPLANITAASFIPHAIFAAIILSRRPVFYWIGWPLLALVAVSPLYGYGWSLCLSASLYVLAAGVLFSGLGHQGAKSLESPAALLQMLLRLALFPSLLVALSLGLLSLLFAVSAHFVSWIASMWCSVLLALCAIVPLVFCKMVRSRQLFAELFLLILVALAIAFAIYPSRHILEFPASILFFPLILAAALRANISGACIVSTVVLTILAVLYDGPATAISFIYAVFSLCFVIAGLMVAVMVKLQQRREHELFDFQTKVDALVNHSPNLMSLKGLDGRFLMVNRAYASMVGKVPSELVGKRVAELFSPEDALQIRAQDERVLRSLEPRQFEESYTVNGQQFCFLVTKFPLFDTKGRPAGIGSVDTDIIESRKQQQATQEAEEKYRAVSEQSLAGIFIYQDGKLAYVNEKLAEILGVLSESLVGATLEQLQLQPECERLQFEQRLQERISNNIQAMHYVARIQRPDGVWLDLEIHSRLFDYQGRVASIGFVLDISDRVAADASQKLVAKVFETSAEGILICDASMQIIAVNAAFSRITGYQADEAIGRMSRVFGDRQRDTFPQMISDLEAQGYWRGEVLDRRKNGDWYPAQLSMSMVRDPQGDVVNYVVLFADITVRKQAEERLNFLANHDPLTRLPNRSSLISSLEEQLLSMEGEDGRLAVIFIDLDRFKLINDSFGHQSGDELLRVIAIRLANMVGSRGILARLGGDEFTLLVSSFTDLSEIATLSEQMLSVLAKPLRLEDHEVFVTGSIGISVYPNDGADARSLLKNADVAMYRAKDSGKNTYQFFSSEMDTQTVERLVMENGMRQALVRNEFELHFQPQVSAGRRELVGVEVLLRWRHPELGLVAPGRFIPLAEETGLIKSIGSWVLTEACRQLTRWDREGLMVPRVAVNLSARQFEQSNLVELVAAALEDSGLAASRLELEITESMIMQNPVETVRILNDLKHLGVQLSIDDFGTGYSSLSILKRFPLDMLKIDKSFIVGLPQDSDSAAITEAVLALSRKLGFCVVAEGVEYENQAHFLENIGCDILQGYYFGKPMPAELFVAWLGGQRQSTSHPALNDALHSVSGHG
jgi:diguanylate cyclase (GGDEF)-like protein/PAS domain S-box-containing protein